jgi:hypothetical protein
MCDSIGSLLAVHRCIERMTGAALRIKLLLRSLLDGPAAVASFADCTADSRTAQRPGGSPLLAIQTRRTCSTPRACAAAFADALTVQTHGHVTCHYANRNNSQLLQHLHVRVQLLCFCNVPQHLCFLYNMSSTTVLGVWKQADQL